MWRNCYYDARTSSIIEYTWDKHGERETVINKFKPFLLVETERETPIKSIYGTSLVKKEFDNSYQRFKFADEYDGRIFFNLKPEQQYLIGKYRREEMSKFMEHDVRVFFLDIECPSRDEFPKPDEAKYEIDILTVYDSLDGKYHMWGKHPYDKTNIKTEMSKLSEGKKDCKLEIIKQEDIIYYEIFDEKERLESFVTYWENNFPDIYTGYNIDGFDTPYIMNRLQMVLGKNQHLRLSPVNKVYTREFLDKFQNPQVSYNIRGISSMDYMEVYKIFTFGAERGSWSLDSVASDVLNCGKIDYEHGNLWDLSKKDWDTYSAYNLVDVGLIVSIEKELNFLEVGRATAYEGYTNFTDCLGKVVTITGSIAKSSLDAGKILETRKPSENTTFEGGYVKQPDAKLRTNIATYDVTSLYPTNMMALGVSLETKIGKVTDRYDNSVFYTINGSMGRKSEDEFLPWLKKMNYCISPADIIFDQSIEGVVNEFVKKQFNNKSEFKKMERKAYAEGDMEKVKEYHRLGQITKIFLNSCYGVISASSSPLFDLDIARSITLTGQYSIRKAAQLADEFARDNFDCKGEIVIGGDTDSIFCDFSEIVENKGKAMFQDDKLTDFGDKLCKVYEHVLNEGVNKWAREELCCINPTFNFEREKAAETALFFAKKQYAYYVLNNEGNDLPVDKRMKYTGLKVVQSGFSPQVKRFFHELYFVTLTQFLKKGSASCRTMVVDLVKRHKDVFMNSGFFEVSKRAKANNLIKWENEFIDRYTAGPSCPIQTKACILHNRLVEDLNLKGKYPELLAGTKAMWAYVKPNKYGFNAVAGNMGVLPPEFELEIDYEKQWEKLYLEVSEQLFRTIKWRFPNLFHDEMVDLDDIFM